MWPICHPTTLLSSLPPIYVLHLLCCRPSTPPMPPSLLSCRVPSAPPPLAPCCGSLTSPLSASKQLATVGKRTPNAHNDSCWQTTFISILLHLPSSDPRHLGPAVVFHNNWQLPQRSVADSYLDAPLLWRQQLDLRPKTQVLDGVFLVNFEVLEDRCWG